MTNASPTSSTRLAREQPTAPGWVRDAVFYQIFPERFANEDHSLDPEGVEPWSSTPTRANFMGGDLAGITRRLDHVAALGADAIYLTPIFEADRNHRYDTVDYFRIDHRLGDLAAFDHFVSEAHRRGIRVVLDAVFNHCGEGHWAFRHVMAHGSSSPYADWFTVEDWPVRREPDPNYATCMGCKYLPQLNHANPEVREYLFSVARFWSERGIDGWRLDVPFLIEQGFWREFRDIVKSLDPDLYIVAEIWETGEEWLRGDIADGTMNYPLRTLITDFAAGRIDARTLVEGMDALRSLTPAWARPSMLNLLGSHDTERVSTLLQGDRARLKTAVALQMTSCGAPMVYYGDELGMQGANDPGCRAPMEWDPSRWDLELYAWHRRLIEIRHRHPALRGPVDKLTALDDDILIRHRAGDRESVFVVVNRSVRAAEVDVNRLGGFDFDVLGERSLALGPDRRRITVPAGATVVLAQDPGSVRGR